MTIKRRVNGKSAEIEILAPQNLPYQLFLVVQQMTRQFQTVLTPHGLTPLHWGILCCLWKEDALRPGDIAQQLTQLGGTITVGLDAMERRKLIERRRDPRDGRIFRLHITEKGRNLRKLLVPEAEDLISAMFNSISPSDYRRLQTIVKSLRVALSGEHIGA